MRNTLRLLFVLLSTAVLHPASGTSKNYLAKAVGTQNPGCDEVKITKQPEDFVAANGGTITIPVEVSGPVTDFKWYKDGGEISGQTSATLVLTGANSSSAGQYRLVATNSCSSVTSNAVQVSVLSPTSLGGMMSVSGDYVPGGQVTYQIVVTNYGQTAQINNPGDEFTNVLPSYLTYASSSASSGSTSFNGSKVSWNGTLIQLNPITITIKATIKNNAGGQVITNQGTVYYDRDGNGYFAGGSGTNEETNPTNTTSFTVSCADRPLQITNSGPLTCAVSSVQLTVTGGDEGSTYVFKPSVLSGSATSPVASVTLAGTYSVTATNPGGCTATAANTTTVVGDKVAAALNFQNLNTAYCKSVPAVPLMASPAGGKFTINQIPSTTLTPSTLAAGIYTVSYSYTAANGCQSTVEQQVTINELPTPTIEGLANAYCQNATAVTLSGNPAGGNFTIDNTAATQFDPATLSVGQHTVVYTYTNGSSCSNTATQSVIVNPLPNVSLTGLATAYCQDAPAVTLAPLGNPAGGSFTLDGSPAMVFTPATLSVGDHTIRYSYSDANGCTNTATKTVTVKQTPTSPTVVTQTGGPYPAGASSLTISQNTGNVILTVSGCTGSSISWNGGSANTLAVSTANLGTQTFTATCTSDGCTSPQATATVTVVAPTLKVLSRDPDNGQLNNNTIKPYLLLQNAGSTPIAYSSITLRYWLTTENNVPLLFQKNYVPIGPNNLNLRYVPLSPARQGATGYIEYSFNAGAGNLASNGDSGPLEVQLNKQDYSLFVQSDDYSYSNNNSFTLNPRITAYQNGVIFYGQEPTGTGGTRVSSEEAGSGLVVNVLGNPVVGQSAEIEISGASGQAVHVKLVDLQGKTLHSQSIREASSVERVSLPLGNAQGLLLLDVSTASQRQQIKILRP
ncbi:cellulose binding domain-containing protein [Spirosoma oryzicola]|uniref:cellulose binding domain-containing protein n=1 Tax=Spirosoma oryzicola TaxID=2898794 RepID=UPI001E60E162|nr:cellulose binding domain-containing protein [Spirosoma oryzicola]UHG92992.1 hypothetical protein LQ777_08840 [Spirosoma oryzicola]